MIISRGSIPKKTKGGMSIIFFDLETTGLPSRVGLRFGEYPSYRELVKYESARVVQMSYMVCDESMNKVSMNDSIINSMGKFNITNSHIHGITNERSTETGEDFVNVMQAFNEALKGAVTLVAHNADFDVNVLKAEMFRQGTLDVLEEMGHKRVVCTMKMCKSVVNATNVYHRLKYPTLRELYEFSTKKCMEKAHDSNYDVINMHEAVKSLVDQNLIQVPT